MSGRNDSELVKLGPADGEGFEPEPPADPMRFEEAVRAFRARVPMLDDDFYDLVESARSKAFTVAAVTQLDIVHDVWRALDKAIADGTSFEDFKREVGAKLTSEWGRENPARLETIFRTNVQAAYGAGRVTQLRSPAVLKRRPFWRFSAILDARTSPICSPLAGLVLPADDPFWNTHQPPLHFNCRSTLIALTRGQAEDFGVDDPPPNAPAQDGFGNVSEDWEPDLERYPEPLQAAYRKKKAA